MSPRIGMSQDLRIGVSQLGSWPGTDPHTALRISLEETPDLPVLPELPELGPPAAMIGRASALLPGLDVDLQPAGWRLHHGAGRDQRIARRWFADDLDRLEELAGDHTGALRIAVAGPWTLAASLELPRGEKVITDHGAGREVAASLAEGIAEVSADLARRLPGLTVTWQLDEPLLPMVSQGALRTASGYGRYRSVDDPQLVERLRVVLDGLVDPWLHCCAADVPVGLLLGIPGVVPAVDAALLTSVGWDAVGSGLDAGRQVALGIARPPAAAASDPDGLARTLLRRWEQLGLDQTPAAGLWLTPACGLAGVTEPTALAVLRALRSAADIVADTLAG